MSRTLFVEFRGHGFWAFDVVSGVFLKFLIDAANTRISGDEPAWLASAVGKWRVNAVISDFGLHLDSDWTADQIQAVTELIHEACNELSNCPEIPATEIVSWPILEGKGIFARGMESIPTKGPIRLGYAIAQLLAANLPEPPPGTWWFFGAEETSQTLPIRHT